MAFRDAIVGASGAQVVLGMQRQHQQHENMCFPFTTFIIQSVSQKCAPNLGRSEKTKFGSISSTIAGPIVQSFHRRQSVANVER